MHFARKHLRIKPHSILNELITSQFSWFYVKNTLICDLFLALIQSKFQKLDITYGIKVLKKNNNQYLQ